MIILYGRLLRVLGIFAKLHIVLGKINALLLSKGDVIERDI
jgi:hypothetical protein